jgi:anionic cell wall polymer biosynthesis LytR-Cps2A-Psr (LCP) family protein
MNKSKAKNLENLTSIPLAIGTAAEKFKTVFNISKTHFLDQMSLSFKHTKMDGSHLLAVRALNEMLMFLLAFG